MFLLISNIAFHVFEIGLAHGKIGISALPFKICKLVTLLLEPAIGNALQLLHPFRLGDCATKATKEMNVVFHSADDQGRAFQRFGNAAELRVRLFTNDLMRQECAKGQTFSFLSAMSLMIASAITLRAVVFLPRVILKRYARLSTLSFDSFRSNPLHSLPLSLPSRSLVTRKRTPHLAGLEGLLPLVLAVIATPYFFSDLILAARLSIGSRERTMPSPSSSQTDGIRLIPTPRIAGLSQPCFSQATRVLIL